MEVPWSTDSQIFDSLAKILTYIHDDKTVYQILSSSYSVLDSVFRRHGQTERQTSVNGFCPKFKRNHKLCAKLIYKISVPVSLIVLELSCSQTHSPDMVQGVFFFRTRPKMEIPAKIVFEFFHDYNTFSLLHFVYEKVDIRESRLPLFC
ncbi:hypothetical protein AVEN_61034-1 [Araneus ventricosus]|uniref:Uncharacterized protein n=1 Tax=Araneus ventricosus TaxID=182803 RepID=A0A4Y2PKN9_ARAVE|nr:hypothetical protein AVEN_61034-1 [Araneus ventricosus]